MVPVKLDKQFTTGSSDLENYFGMFQFYFSR